MDSFDMEAERPSRKFRHSKKQKTRDLKTEKKQNFRNRVRSKYSPDDVWNEILGEDVDWFE